MKKITSLAIALFIGTLTNAQSLSELYQIVNSSIVVIKTQSNTSAGLGDKKKVNTEEGLGSGVLISDDGLIWTASHVVHSAEKIAIKFTDGDIYEAEVLSTSPSADVAMIKIIGDFQLKNKYVATIGDSDKVVIGQEIFVIGSPLGIEQTLTRGIVSGKITQGNVFSPVEFIQTDAAINPGNSGGPLFNMDGEVIGIASFIMSQSGGFVGLGFGASSNVATKILMEQKSVWSGMEFAFLEGEMAEVFNLPQEAGLLVLSVTSKGLGNKLGLRGGFINANIEGSPILIGGDILLEIAGVKLENAESLNLLKKKMVIFENNNFEVKYLRAGKVYTSSVKN
ncbi:MAG: trypsin-like peptidase domain-containing protein [Flavobacteriaceae bacterium]